MPPGPLAPRMADRLLTRARAHPIVSCREGAKDVSRLPFEKGGSYGVITANDQLATRAAGFDCAIVVPCRESMGGPDKVATFYSQTCMRYVLECVYGTVFARSYEKSRQHKTLAERELRQ